MGHTVYRICPFGFDKWKVQRRRPFWFWTTVSSYQHECIYATRPFASETEAELYIDRQIAQDRLDTEYESTVARRKREIRPRRYP